MSAVPPCGSRLRRTLGVLLLLIVAQPEAGRSQSTFDEALISPTGGLSWLNHRQILFEQSCFGRAGRSGGSARPGDRASDGSGLTGGDLYRYSCQSCHRADGTGCGSEIKPLLDPVRGSHPSGVQASMEERGITLPEEMASALAAQNKAALLDRLQHGGEKMPSFAFLTLGERDQLIDYLWSLSGVTEKDDHNEKPISVSRLRVGELIVKGTCHVCHNARDPGLYQGSWRNRQIPSLETIRRDRTVQEFVRKVREGTLNERERRGQMPVFSYLSEAEVLSAFIYLVGYSPVDAVAVTH